MTSPILTLLEQLLQEVKQTNLILLAGQEGIALNPSMQVQPSQQPNVFDLIPPQHFEPVSVDYSQTPEALPAKVFIMLSKPVVAGRRTNKFGINNADYRVSYKDTKTGKTVNCGYYDKWKNLLRSHYSQATLSSTGGGILNKPYKGHKVQGEWLYFMNFRRWYIAYELELGLPAQVERPPTLMDFDDYNSDSGADLPSDVTKDITYYTDEFKDPEDAENYHQMAYMTMIEQEANPEGEGDWCHCTRQQAAYLLQYYPQDVLDNKLVELFMELYKFDEVQDSDLTTDAI